MLAQEHCVLMFYSVFEFSKGSNDKTPLVEIQGVNTSALKISSSR